MRERERECVRERERGRGWDRAIEDIIKTEGSNKWISIRLDCGYKDHQLSTNVLK